MPINWQDPAVKDQLLAAILASFDNKVNCKEVARYFGGEATYNAIENFLRGPKKKAQQLKAQAADSTGPVPSPKRPRKPKEAVADGVKTGRVIKPKKANGVMSSSFSSSQIKNEVYDDEGIYNMSGVDADVEVGVDDGEYA